MRQFRHFADWWDTCIFFRFLQRCMEHLGWVHRVRVSIFHWEYWLFTLLLCATRTSSADNIYGHESICSDKPSVHFCKEQVARILLVRQDWVLPRDVLKHKHQFWIQLDCNVFWNQRIQLQHTILCLYWGQCSIYPSFYWYNPLRQAQKCNLERKIKLISLAW